MNRFVSEEVSLATLIRVEIDHLTWNWMWVGSGLSLDFQLLLLHNRGSRYPQDIRFNERSDGGHGQPSLERDLATVGVGRSPAVGEELLSHLYREFHLRNEGGGRKSGEWGG